MLDSREFGSQESSPSRWNKGDTAIVTYTEELLQTPAGHAAGSAALWQELQQRCRQSALDIDTDLKCSAAPSGGRISVIAGVSTADTMDLASRRTFAIGSYRLAAQTLGQSLKYPIRSAPPDDKPSLPLFLHWTRLRRHRGLAAGNPTERPLGRQ